MSKNQGFQQGTMIACMHIHTSLSVSRCTIASAHPDKPLEQSNVDSEFSKFTIYTVSIDPTLTMRHKF